MDIVQVIHEREKCGIQKQGISNSTVTILIPQDVNQQSKLIWSDFCTFLDRFSSFFKFVVINKYLP